uniref:Vomeronasal type-1 receptor n=1 Tax=Romanomermis culicivorax TaxID=13658 RepID=A0A915IML6_ROMCU
MISIGTYVYRFYVIQYEGSPITKAALMKWLLRLFYIDTVCDAAAMVVTILSNVLCWLKIRRSKKQILPINKSKYRRVEMKLWSICLITTSLYCLRITCHLIYLKEIAFVFEYILN